MSGGLTGRLEDGAHTLQVRVYFEDTDFSGAVYHASYVRFIERGRSDFLRALGISHRALATQGLTFVVRQLHMTYHRAARIDDVLEIVTTLKALTGVRIVLSQVVRDGDGLVAEGEVTVALIDRDGRLRRLPADVFDRLSVASRSKN